MLAGLIPKSLTLRAIALSTLWAAIALVAIASVIIALYRDASERGMRSLLSSHLSNLIAQTDVTAGGQLTGAPDLGDPNYTRWLSGWYWTVEPVTASVKGGLRSISTANRSFAASSVKEAPFDSNFRRDYPAEGLDGEALIISEAEVEMGSADKVARFRVMGNHSELDAGIGDFARRLYLYLALFGLGSIAVNALAILAGLHPLRRASEALKQVREGTAQRLDGAFPSEIAPLAREMNALIDNNRRIVERSRTQVGNLAHSLKTPLAVMSNEGHLIGGAKGAVIAEQAGAMQRQIQHYLQRARIAAQRDSVVFRAPVMPVLERLRRVMQKLNPAMSFSLSASQQAIVFGGEAQDLEEMIGNLLENAAKWGKKRVSIKVATAGPSMFSVEIGDDGPGLSSEQLASGIKRGKRMDESKPGTGLGLSIVSDAVREYGGAMLVGKSELGGLSVSITLPSVS